MKYVPLNNVQYLVACWGRGVQLFEVACKTLDGAKIAVQEITALPSLKMVDVVCLQLIDEEREVFWIRNAQGLFEGDGLATESVKLHLAEVLRQRLD